MPSRCISHRRIVDGPSPVNSEVFQAGMARCSTISTGRSAASPIPTLLSTTGSRTMTKPVKSNRTGTLPCVRAISGAWGLPPTAVLEAVVVALEALLPHLVRLEVLLPHLLLPLLAPRLLLVLLQVAAQVAVEELPLHRSFSAAMAGRLTSRGTPPYS